jgi:hypothetical protein
MAEIRFTYTAKQDPTLTGQIAHLGDIVALGIEPGEPVGRIVSFFRRTDLKNGYKSHIFGTVVVCDFDGVVRSGNLGIGWVGYCRREDWDGPTPNGLSGLLWPKKGE